MIRHNTGSNPVLTTTKIRRDGLELVPAESHKLNDAGSIPAPATKQKLP